MGHLIDLQSWKRRDHFQFYGRFSQPFFSVTAEIDVTALRRRCRDTGKGPRSFFLSTMFATLRAAHAGEALRLRIRDQGVWLHECVSIGTTVLREDETFAFAQFDPIGDFEEFCSVGAAEVARARATADPLVAPAGDFLIYHSTLPWLRFMSFTNARNGDDSIPRLVFGKCAEVPGGYRLPVAVEVHHALVDGIDVARFLDCLEREMAACAEL